MTDKVRKLAHMGYRHKEPLCPVDSKMKDCLVDFCPNTGYIPHGPAVPLPGINPREIFIQDHKVTCLRLLIQCAYGGMKLEAA